LGKKRKAADLRPPPFTIGLSVDLFDDAALAGIHQIGSVLAVDVPVLTQRGSL
jgi:hypothetical protein